MIRFASPPLLRGLGQLCLAMSLTAASTAFAEPPALTHKVREGDNLHDLALKYLDDPMLWPALGAANGVSNPYRLPVGMDVGIPLELLRRKAGGAEVVHVSGTVTRARDGEAASALALGERVVDGDVIETAQNGFVTLRLADGSHVRIAGDSIARMEQLKYVVRRKRSDTVIDMERGRVESSVARQAGRSRFRIQSPLMAAGVRGTHFGVSVTPDGTVTSDVLEGAVQVSALASAASVRVNAGHGTVASSASKVATPSRLLPAPDLSAVPALHQKPLLDIAFPALPDAHAYRVYVARDPELHEVMANATAQAPRVRVTDLDDGRYFIALRAIGASGIEGKPAIMEIELDARPLPPLTIAPEHGAEQGQGEALLRWTSQEQAVGYEVEMARDEGFTDAVFTARAVAGTETTASDLASGSYFWRVRAIARDASGALDKGPFGDPRRFAVRRSLAISPVQDGENMRLRWEAEPDQQFFLQVSDEPGFSRLVHEIRTLEREADLSALPGGDYFLRVQVTDSDGYVRPFSPSQQFRVQSFIKLGDDGLLRTGDDKPVGRG